jgi:hypothetical protein
MKHLLLVFALTTFGSAYAQSVNVDQASQDGEGTTTIQIKKTKNVDAAPAGCEKIWEFTDGTADVTGDTQALATEARTSWKKACDGWMKEFRADNKENRIIAISCGQANCTGESAKKTCVSTATYKIKSKMN